MPELVGEHGLVGAAEDLAVDVDPVPWIARGEDAGVESERGGPPEIDDVGVDVRLGVEAQAVRGRRAADRVVGIGQQLRGDFDVAVGEVRAPVPMHPGAGQGEARGFEEAVDSGEACFEDFVGHVPGTVRAQEDVPLHRKRCRQREFGWCLCGCVAEGRAVEEAVRVAHAVGGAPGLATGTRRRLGQEAADPGQRSGGGRSRRHAWGRDFDRNRIASAAGEAREVKEQPERE